MVCCCSTTQASLPELVTKTHCYFSDDKSPFSLFLTPLLPQKATSVRDKVRGKQATRERRAEQRMQMWYNKICSVQVHRDQRTERSESSISISRWETYRKLTSACSLICRHGFSTTKKLLIHARNKELAFYTASATETSVSQYYQL